MGALTVILIFVVIFLISTICAAVRDIERERQKANQNAVEGREFKAHAERLQRQIQTQDRQIKVLAEFAMGVMAENLQQKGEIKVLEKAIKHTQK